MKIDYEGLEEKINLVFDKYKDGLIYKNIAKEAILNYAKSHTKTACEKVLDGAAERAEIERKEIGNSGEYEPVVNKNSILALKNEL